MLCDKKSTNIGVNGVDISMINKDNAHHNNLNVTNQDECTTTDETSFLKEKIRMLEKMVNDKDQEITFLRDMLSKKC